MAPKFPHLFGLASTFLASMVLGTVFGTSTSAQLQSGPPDLRETGAPEAASVNEALPTRRFGAGPMHRVWLEGEKKAELRARLEQSGGLVRPYDYGAFAVAIVDARLMTNEQMLRSDGFDVRNEQDLMVFNEIVVDGRQPERTLANLPAALR